MPQPLTSTKSRDTYQRPQAPTFLPDMNHLSDEEWEERGSMEDLHEEEEEVQEEDEKNQRGAFYCEVTISKELVMVISEQEDPLFRLTIGPVSGTVNDNGFHVRIVRESHLVACNGFDSHDGRISEPYDP